MSNSICIVTEALQAYQCFTKCMSREWDPIAVPESMSADWDTSMGIPFLVEIIKHDCAEIVGEVQDDDERLVDSWLQRYKELQCTRNKKWWVLKDQKEILSMCLALGLDDVEYAELTGLVIALQDGEKKENQQHIIETRQALRDVDRHGDKQKIVDAHVDYCMKYLTTLHAAHVEV